jgi:SH3-like domain-containing protein
MALMSPLASALEFRAIAAPKAILYDAPSSLSKKLFILGQGYPVEIIVNLGEWLKVRDNQGGLSWIEAQRLTNKRTVLVTANLAEIRQTANTNAILICHVEKDLVLELLEPTTTGWAKVRHRDGLVGYIQTSSIWGL